MLLEEEKIHPPLVEDGLELIHSQYPYLYGSQDMAQRLEVSAPHFIREFKKAVGQSPTNYLIHYKLEQSKKLLLTEHLYVDTVANLVGFSCGNYFAKVFRKHYGMTPTEYSLAHKGQGGEEGEFPELYL